jgi:hypothetical protein
MTTYSTDQQLVLPVNTDGNDVVTHIGLLVEGFSNDGVESRLVKRYLSSTDRTARNPTPNQGELSYLDNVKELDSYDGTNWQYVWSLAAPRGIIVTPNQTLLASPGTSSTTETKDTSLGDYTFTAVAGRRYRVTLSSAIMSGTVAGDWFAIRIRDGGASSPTSASTFIGGMTFHPKVSNTTASRENGTMSCTINTLSAGTHTLGVFMQRTGGTGTMQLDSPNSDGVGSGYRELYVEDIGNV